MEIDDRYFQINKSRVAFVNRAYKTIAGSTLLRILVTLKKMSKGLILSRRNTINCTNKLMSSQRIQCVPSRKLPSSVWATLTMRSHLPIRILRDQKSVTLRGTGNRDIPHVPPSKQDYLAPFIPSRVVERITWAACILSGILLHVEIGTSASRIESLLVASILKKSQEVLLSSIPADLPSGIIDTKHSKVNVSGLKFKRWKWSLRDGLHL